MYFKAMFDQGSIPVLEKVISFCEQRNRVLANNIANIDTPYYRRRELPVAEFQAQLQKAIDHREKTNPRVFQFQASRNITPNTLGGVTARPLIEPLRNGGFLRHDGNSVNIDREMAELSKNTLLHNVMVQILIKEFNMLNTAISGNVVK